MRPVHRGECPCDANGNPRNFFPEYTLARKDLIDRIGEYCSFCESPIPASLAIEHILPKRPAGHTEDIPERVGDWNNFLLACVNCNSRKGTKEFPDKECMFPDRDDTFSAISYEDSGLLQANHQRAKNLIDLVGLNARPKTISERLRASDRRWQHRLDVWKLAKEMHKDALNTPDDERYINCVVNSALAKGFWSIWMTVFKDIPTVREKLLSQFPGTKKEYFQSPAVL